MIFLPLTIFCIIGGFMLYFMTYVFPIMRLMYMDWIALFVMIIPSIMFLYALGSRRLIWFLERTPKNKMLILFLRRDGDVVPVLGSRAYPGESFIDVPRLGLIHDLGNVYRLGQNNVRFALENVNHTADPTYANFTSWLYKIGFNNIKELQAVLTPKKDDDGGASAFPEKEEEVLEKMEITEFKAEPVETAVDELIDAKTDFTVKKEEPKKQSAGMDFIAMWKDKYGNR